jgi:ribosomal protein S8
MQISKPFLWMEKYIEDAKRTHPKIKRLKRIYKIPFTCDKRQKACGMCHELTNNTYEIGLTLNYQNITFKNCNTVTVKPERLSKIDILEFLAHELAHVAAGFDHTTKHKKLECKFKSRFMTILEKEGYVSEEYELKTKEK